MDMSLKSYVAVALACMLPVATIASDVAGSAVSDGEFRVNGSAVSGSATLFNGNAVQTSSSPSRLELNGAWMLLASNSLVRVNSGNLILERGLGEVGSNRNFELEARTLRIVPSSAGLARVKLDGERKVLVGALNGPVRVFNAAGTLVASLNAGTTLSFLPNAAAADAFDVTGCLLWKDNSFIVVDPSGQKVAVRGTAAELAKLSGNPVHITGSGVGKTTDGISIVKLATVTSAGSGGCLAAARAENAQLTPPAGMPATGPGPTPKPIKPPHTGLILAGVGVGAAAAIGIGVGLSGGKNNGSKPPQS